MLLCYTTNFFPKKLLLRSFEKNDAVSIPVLNTFKITTFPHLEHRSNITESPFYNCIGSRNANKRQSICSKLCVRMLLSPFFMNWWGKLRFTSYKILWGDNAWYGTLTRESGFDKSQCWKPPLFPNVCPRLANKFLMGELIDHQKNVQQRKSECLLQLSRTLGVSLNICRKSDFTAKLNHTQADAGALLQVRIQLNFIT